MMETMKRHPNRQFSRLPLTEKQGELQIAKGLYTVQGGVPMPIPVDSVSKPKSFLDRKLWVKDENGIHRPGAVFLPRYQKSRQQKILEFLRDHVNADIPRMYYKAVLGHDLHVSKWADLSAKHFHAGWANPFNPEEVEVPEHFDHDCDKSYCAIRNGERAAFGFTENVGWLSGGKVTDVFVNVEVGALVDAAASGEAAEFNDFNEHEVGTSNTAENNDQTALIVSSGIALQAGTQVDDGGDPPTMTTVATITADATETWEEHGVFSTTVDSLMDRSLTGGQSVNSSDTVEYTYTLTVNPEA